VLLYILKILGKEKNSSFKYFEKGVKLETNVTLLTWHLVNEISSAQFSCKRAILKFLVSISQNLLGYVRWAISYLIKEEVGTKSDYAMLSRTVLFSINRWATKLRTKSSTLVVPSWRDPKDATVFVRFTDEVKNQEDDFIRTFVDNENAFKDPAFLRALKDVRVSCLFNLSFL
jgi:hypothetical protein